MKNYKNWMKRNEYSKNAIRTYSNQLQKFFDWCEMVQVNPRGATVDDLYNYVDYYRQKGYRKSFDDPTIYKYSPRTLREKMKVIKLYYVQIKRKTNPALLVRIEKPEEKLPKNKLDSETLLEIYLSYIPKNMTQKRNRIILGLMVFQGLSRQDIELLEVEHVEIANERLYVPSSKRTNRRYIDLRKSQKDELENYLYELRPLLLREASKNTSKLVFSYGAGGNLNSVFKRLLIELKMQCSYIETLKQLRDSRITIWIKEHGLREAQYLAGMKFVSSLLRFYTKNNDELRKKLIVVHPMERMRLIS